MFPAVAVAAAVVAIGAVVYSFLVGCRLNALKATLQIHEDRESDRRTKSISDLAARLSALEGRAKSLELEFAAITEEVHSSLGVVTARLTKDLDRVNSEMSATKASTVEEVVDLLRRQTESLRHDLVARLSEVESAD